MESKLGWAIGSALAWCAVASCVALGQSFPSAGQDEAEQDYYLAEPRFGQTELISQAQPRDETTDTADAPARPPRPAPPRPAFNLLAGAPNMFGDFFDGSAGILTFTPAPIVIQQTWTDGNPFDLFVTNPGGLGANADPTIPIRIAQGPGGPNIAQSIGAGIDTDGNNQPDSYAISEPVGSSPGTGFIYNGGNAVFIATPGNPNSVGNPDGWQLDFSHTQVLGPVRVVIPAGGGASVRRIKIAENESPQPRDRVFLNYNFFNDVIGGFGDVNRYTAGVEKTFFDGCSSLEFRAPFASTLASDQFANGTQLKDTELGNAAVIYKVVLYQTDCGLIAGGFGVTLPLSDSTRVFGPGGGQILEWESESVHVLPYLAFLSTPNESWFWQAFWQFDIDANGNFVAGDLNGVNLQPLGVIQDATLMFVDIGAGRRLYDNPCANCIQGVSAVAELHYSTTVQDADFINRNGLTVGSFTNRFDVLNLTLGVTLLSRNNISIRPAMVIPLRDDGDEQFDYEAVVQVNVRL